MRIADGGARLRRQRRCLVLTRSVDLPRAAAHNGRLRCLNEAWATACAAWRARLSRETKCPKRFTVSILL
jgi:hypothetical protein